MFTLSFFNQQAFTKYTSSLASAGQANGALTNTAFHALTQVAPYDIAKARNLMRLLHAFHHMVRHTCTSKDAPPGCLTPAWRIVTAGVHELWWQTDQRQGVGDAAGPQPADGGGV